MRLAPQGCTLCASLSSSSTSSPLLDPGAGECIRAVPSFHDGVQGGGQPLCLRVRASRVAGAHMYTCARVCVYSSVRECASSCRSSAMYQRTLRQRMKNEVRAAAFHPGLWLRGTRRARLYTRDVAVPLARRVIRSARGWRERHSTWGFLTSSDNDRLLAVIGFVSCDRYRDCRPWNYADGILIRKTVLPVCLA